MIFFKNIRVFNEPVKTVTITTCFKRSLRTCRDWEDERKDRKRERERERGDESPYKLLAVWLNNYTANLSNEQCSVTTTRTHNQDKHPQYEDAIVSMSKSKKRERQRGEFTKIELQPLTAPFICEHCLCCFSSQFTSVRKIGAEFRYKRGLCIKKHQNS